MTINDRRWYKNGYGVMVEVLIVELEPCNFVKVKAVNTNKLLSLHINSLLTFNALPSTSPEIQRDNSPVISSL